MSNVAEEQLKFENAFQQVLITLATRFINIPVDQMDQAITEALRQIVEFLGGMRASVNQINEERTHYSTIYEWSSLNDALTFPDLVPIPEASETIPALERGEIITVANITDLPESSSLRQLLASYGIVSLAVVPIIRQQRLIGFVATSWMTPRTIQKEIIDLLHVVAEIFLNAQDRRDNETRIRKLNEELEKHVEERTSELRATNERLQSEIAERQQVEEALRISEERYRVTTELISDYAFLCRVEANGDVNLDWITEDPFERLTGYSNPREAYALYHPEDAERVHADVARTLQGNSTEGEYRIITRSGEIRWLYFRRVPLWDARHEHVDHFYGVAQDITSRRQTEEALRVSEERYRIISEAISDYAFLYRVEPDRSLKLEWLTAESYTRLTGYTLEDIGQPYRRYSPEDEALARADVERTLQGETVDREYRVVTKSGELRWIYMRRYPIWDEQHQRVERFYGVAQDITRRKQIEEELRLSEERYRIISEVISDYAFLYQVEDDGSLKLEWITRESYIRLIGYTPEETISGDDLYSKEYHDISRQDVERTLRGEAVDREYRTITKSGDVRWIYMRRFPIWDERHERVVRFYGVAQDITPRKQAEEALRQNEERYRIISEVISDYAFLFQVEADRSLKLEWITRESYTRVTGYTPEESSNTDRRFSPEFDAQAREDVERTLQGESVDREYRALTKSGDVRWIYMRRFPIWDAEQERVVRFYGVAQDITRRKQIEEALRQSEERYRIVNQLISDYAFVYRVEPDGNIVHEWITADSYLRLTGYTYGEGNNTYHLYHPDDADLAAQDVQATIRGQTTEREYRIITKAGEMRWIYMHRYPIWDEQEGRVVRFYGVAQDITQRKRIEANEREQRALAEALLDTVDALNSTLDLDEVLDRILANIDRVVPHNEGAILLIEAEVARVVRAKGSSDRRKTLETLRFPLADTPSLREVYETNRPLVIPDVREYPGWIEITDFGIRCHACVPIEQDNQVIGFLTWDSTTPNSFNPKTLMGLQAFAHQTAVAITNAKLYQQGQALAILEERQRLARDLHDAVTQTLFSASMIAEMLLRQWDHNPEQVRQGLAQLHLLTRGALAEMRSLLIELRPEALDGVGLPRLISQLAEAFSGRTGILPTVTIEGERTLPLEVKIALYRIAQEALNNVSKHARASEVHVKLSMDRMVELTLWDNGRGFLPEQMRSDSFGLKIMRERAELIGARLTIASEPGKQTTLKVEWMG